MDICVLYFLLIFSIISSYGLSDFNPTVMHCWLLWISELIANDCFQIALNSMLKALMFFVVYFNTEFSWIVTIHRCSSNPVLAAMPTKTVMDMKVSFFLPGTWWWCKSGVSG